MKKGQRLVKKPAAPKLQVSPEQRLLVLDTWRRSGLPAADFSTIVDIPHHTLYNWKKRFEQEGPAGLMDRPRGGRKGSKLPELTKRTILMLKESNPDWGCQRVSDMLVRGLALPASPTAVARVLKEAGIMNKDEKIRYLANVCCLLVADGDIGPTEQEVLEDIARDIGAGAFERQEAVQRVRGPGYQVRPVGRWSQRIRNLEDMLFAAYCNGVFEQTGKKAIKEYARQLGIDQKQFDHIKRETKHRYAEFKARAT